MYRLYIGSKMLKNFKGRGKCVVFQTFRWKCLHTPGANCAHGAAFLLEIVNTTAWKVSKYKVISGPNTGKYGPEITPYLDTFRAVYL